MDITIKLKKQKAMFLLKILRRIQEGRNDFIKKCRDGGREYLVSIEDIGIFDDTINDVVSQLTLF